MWGNVSFPGDWFCFNNLFGGVVVWGCGGWVVYVVGSIYYLVYMRTEPITLGMNVIIYALQIPF